MYLRKGFFVTGNSLLILAMVFYFFTFLFSLGKGKSSYFKMLSRYSLYIAIAFNWIVYGYFAFLMVSHQFQFDYVYQHTCLSMPTALLIASSWAGQSGSLFLWSFFCSFPLLFVHKKEDWKKGILPILLIQQLVILGLILGSKPFAPSAILFQDGLGMNPTLSHTLMVIHPPFAFLGYSFLSLLFAYSIVSLLTTQLTVWLTSAKKFSLIALTALTITTLLGSIWAYQVIGWGGLWSFDPIENGTLITCLLLIAFLHSLSLYQKQKCGLGLLYVLSLIIYSSVIHMVLLIRSGLLTNLTQHSYAGSGLLIALLFSDVITFVVPLTMLLFQSKKIPSHPLTVSLFSKTGRTRAVIWLLLAMSGVLFFDLNQPLMTTFLSYPSPVLSYYLRVMFMTLAFITFLFLSLSSSPFSHQRSIRFHGVGKVAIQVLTSSLIALVLLLNFKLGITNQTILLFVLLLVPLTGLLKTIHDLKKCPWFLTGKGITHLAMCLVLISFLLTNVGNLSERVSLEKNIPYSNKEYTLTQLETNRPLPQYVGEKEFFPIQVNKGSFSFISTPSLWTYQRKGSKETLAVPSIQLLPDVDFVIVPKHSGLKTLFLKQTSTVKEYLITLEEYITKIEENGIKTESVFISIQTEKNQENDRSFISENLRLTRKITQKGVPLEQTSAKSILMNETITWVHTEDEKTITISSPTIQKTHEFEILIKPYMLLLRISYLFLGLSLLWYVALLFLEKKARINHRIKNKLKPQGRSHHAHHHQ